MKPVNLLPEEHRPSRPTGQRSGVAYVLIGGLAVVLVAVLAYVMSANEVTSKQDTSADLSREAKDLDAQIGSLGPVSNFLSIKQSREQSVRDLAGRRFDWERLTREVARVIPNGVFVKELNASTDGQGVGTATPAAQTAAAATGAPTGPALSITGCARTQRDVATLLVRLKQLHLSEDAVLKESKRVAADEGVAGPAPSSVSAGLLGVDTPCTGYEFEASVNFDPSSVAVGSADAEPVPASLGGGK